MAVCAIGHSFNGILSTAKGFPYILSFESIKSHHKLILMYIPVSYIHHGLQLLCQEHIIIMLVKFFLHMYMYGHTIAFGGSKFNS